MPRSVPKKFNKYEDSGLHHILNDMLQRLRELQPKYQANPLLDLSHHYILNLNRIIKNITALLDYNKSELNVNKKILCFIDYDNVIHTNKLIEIFQNKCILFNTLEPRFNLPINIIIILLKIGGRLEELKGSILEDIKQYKLIDNNYVIEKFILNKSTLIREK